MSSKFVARWGLLLDLIANPGAAIVLYSQ